MTSKSITIGKNLNAVTAALMEAQMLPLNIFLFGSRARGDARPDSDIDLLVIVQQATLSPLERQQVLRSLRAALRPLQLPLACGGKGPAGRNTTSCRPLKTHCYLCAWWNAI